ncbi:hypothetical protein [Shewanella sp. GXUN23E]|uniref:hypothetical protein n=1 Tax=Shewanella sp. GXUN23E TaxID=3422498 RepID=UPI003D7C466C
MKYLALLIALGLSGCCATPVVYLQYGDNPGLADEVKQRLETRGVDVQLLESPLPYSTAKAELLIHPLLNGGDLLELVKQSLQEAGLADISVNDFNHSKHFYTPGHLGIYLPRQQTRLPVVMQTRDCGEIHATLERLSDTQVILEMAAQPQDISIQGTYVMTGDKGVLTLGEVRYAFTLMEIEVDTLFGLRPADLILLESGSPRRQAFDQCEFITVYGG